MMIPRVLRIAAFDISVEEMPTSVARAAERLGEFSNVEQCIRVQTQDLSKWIVLDTLLHELVHAIFSCYSLDDDDDQERLASVMGTALAQVCRDNPDLIKWILWLIKQ